MRHRAPALHPEDEDTIAARAVEAWWAVEGTDELAQAAREALVAIAQEALARKEARLARERRAARQRKAEQQAARERAARRAREEREAAEREAREARLMAVERNHRRGRVSRRPRGLSVVVGAPAAREEVSALRAAVEEPMEAVEVEDATEEEVGWEAFEVVALDDEEDEDAEVEDAPRHHEQGKVLSDQPLTGRDLAAWRASLGLTQQQAADRLGVRQGTVSKAEGRGEKVLGPAVGAALAGVLASGPVARRST